MSEDANLIENWKKHLEQVTTEVLFLNHYRQVRAQFYIIAAQSPEGKTASDLWEFAHRAFTHEMANIICRLTEKQWVDKKGNKVPGKEIYSLTALLTEMETKPTLLSIESFFGFEPVTLEEYLKHHPCKLSPPDTFPFTQSKGLFESIVGSGNTHMPKEFITKDLSDLAAVTEQMKQYRNKILAHNSVDATELILLVDNEIKDAIALIIALTRKYNHLLLNRTHPLEFGNIDITPFFMESWIKDENRQHELIKQFLTELKI